MARKNGFTLLELLIVVAVIGVLAASQMTTVAENTREIANQHAGVQIANLAIGVRTKAQDPITPLPEQDYNDLRLFKFEECRPDLRDAILIGGTLENNVVVNGIPEDDGNPATPDNGQGALVEADYPRMTRFMGCGQRMVFQDTGVMSIDNIIAVPEVSIPDPADAARTIVLRDEIPAGEAAMELERGVFTIRVDVGNFLNGNRENRFRQLSSLVFGFEQTMFANHLVVPDQVRIFPFTIQEIEAFLDDRAGANEQFVEVDIPIRLGDFLRTDGSVNLQDGAQLCWEIIDAGNFETACLEMGLNVDGEVTLGITAADAARVPNNRWVNVEIENQGNFIHQSNPVLPRITGMQIVSVSNGDFVAEPVCPAGFDVRIAASLSTVTDVDAAVLPANNWGDNRNSEPDLGESSEIGAVGVGWDQVAGGWNITSNVMSSRLGGGNQASGSRFNISTWCEG